jgi:uncharacterized delta-60 repeat protein
MRTNLRSRRRGAIQRSIIETMEARTLLSAASLDTTFGTGSGGTVQLAVAPESPRNPTLALESSGRIISAEPADDHTSRIIGLKPDGSFDPKFGFNGFLSVSDDSIVSVLLESDGSIMLVGKDLTHLSANGVLDTAFGGQQTGQVVLPSRAQAAAIQSNNQIVVAASDGSNGVVVSRYNSDGSLDTNYGSGGSESLVSSSFTQELAGAMAIDGQGRAVIGMGVLVQGGQEFAIARLTTTGQIDDSFGGGSGFVANSSQEDDAACTGLVIGPDGTIYQTGTFDQFSGDEESPLEAYSTTGQLLATNLLGVGQANGGLMGMAIQSNGKLIVTGYGDVPSVILVDRFLPASQGLSLDKSFNGTGQTTFAPLVANNGPTNFGNVGWSVALQTNGEILVAGTSSDENVDFSEYTITRLTGDPVQNVSGMVYADINGNGKRDTGDIGIAGQTVYADLNNNGVLNAGEPVTTTDSSGAYTLTGVPQGAQIVRQILQNVEKQSSPSGGLGQHVTVGGSGVTGADFGVVLGYLTGTQIGTPGSYKNQGNTLAKAFDGNLNTFFDAPDPSGDWAGFDLGSAKVVTELSYAPRSAWASRMVGGQFEGSNSADFSIGVVTLFNVTSTPATGVLTSVQINDPSAYRYIRYIGPNGAYSNIAEVKFFGFTPVVGATLTADGTLVVNGTSGADNIHATLGPDAATVVINGTTDNFAGAVLKLIVNAGAGNDTVLVDGGESDARNFTITLNGGDGNDNLTITPIDATTTSVTAYLDGGAGDDTLDMNFAGTGTLIGGDGNDTFNSNGIVAASALHEAVYGGDGNDTLVADGDTVYSIYDGGFGSNTIDYHTQGDSTPNDNLFTLNMAGGFLTNVNTVIGSSELDGVICNNNGDTITYPDAAGNGVTITGGSGNDVINIHNASLDGDPGVVVNGNGGNDQITITGSANVSVNGGAGNDVIHVRGDFAPVIVDGGADFDTAFTDA